jgi:DNA-binding transcriptional LysR family regulator
MLMTLHQLTLFCNVTDRGSFSLASYELRISQPALSIQIRRLEEELGLKLLTRSREGVQLTRAGKIFYECAKTILKDVEHTRQRVEEVSRGIKSPVRVGVSPTGVFNFVMETIKGYLEAFPETDVQLTVDSRLNILSLLSQRRIDVVFEYGPINERTYSKHHLMYTDFHVACSPKHPCARSREFPKERFLSENYIDLYHGPGIPSYAVASLLKAKLSPKIMIVLPSIDAIKKAVEANMGIGLLSDLSVAKEQEAGILKVLALQGFRLRREILAVYLKDEAILPSVTRFIEFSKKSAKKRVPESEKLASDRS